MLHDITAQERGNRKKGAATKLELRIYAKCEVCVTRAIKLVVIPYRPCSYVAVMGVQQPATDLVLDLRLVVMVWCWWALRATSMLQELTCLLPLPCSARAGIAALFCEGSAYGLSHFKADTMDWYMVLHHRSKEFGHVQHSSSYLKTILSGGADLSSPACRDSSQTLECMICSTHWSLQQPMLICMKLINEGSCVVLLITMSVLCHWATAPTRNHPSILLFCSYCRTLSG